MECVRQQRCAQSVLQIMTMQFADFVQVSAEVACHGGGKHCPAVFVSLSLADDDLTQLKIDILDSQAEAFHQPQSTTVQQQRDQTVSAVELIEYPSHFISTEDDR